MYRPLIPQFSFISFFLDRVARLDINKITTIIYINYSDIPFFFYFLRDHMKSQFKYLMDITTVDYPDNVYRFTVVYHLLSITYNTRICVKTFVDEISPLQSITDVYSCANWCEREIWDMFGIFFLNHPDCRRILTDYGFEGHPLRKDFPLTGYVEVSFDDSKKKVQTESISLDQEYRYFNFSSPPVATPL